MPSPKEFIKQVEIFLNTRIGAILTRYVLKNNASKLLIVASRITTDDAKAFIEHIVKAISLFVSSDESKLVKAELDKFYPR
jgi:hypothetical protein